MGVAVVTVATGGLPVVDVTATKPALGLPVTEAVNGRGIPVTKVSLAVGGLPVTFVAASNYWPPSADTNWVPANAKVHIDFLGGSPQGRAWSNGAAVAIDTLLGSDPATDDPWGTSAYQGNQLDADGYPVGTTAFIGTTKTMVLNAVTMVVRWVNLEDPAHDKMIFAALSEDGNDGIEIEAGGAVNRVRGTSWGGSLSRIISGVINTPIRALNQIAFTLTSNRLDMACNGSTATTDVLSSIDRPVGNPLATAFISKEGIIGLHSITIYDPLPTTAGLSALSVAS